MVGQAIREYDQGKRAYIPEYSISKKVYLRTTILYFTSVKGLPELNYTTQGYET